MVRARGGGAARQLGGGTSQAPALLPPRASCQEGDQQAVPFLPSRPEEDPIWPSPAFRRGGCPALHGGSSCTPAHSHSADPGPAAEPRHRRPLQGTGGHAAQVGGQGGSGAARPPAPHLPAITTALPPQGRPLLHRLLPPLCQPEPAGPAGIWGEVSFLRVLPGRLHGWEHGCRGCQPL